MPQTPQRGDVPDANAERASFNERSEQLQQVETFAPVNAPVRDTRILDTLLKFGKQASLNELRKQEKSSFIQGQALRAAGQELGDSPPAATRKGFKAMDAKLTMQNWSTLMKQDIDDNDNNLSLLEYNELLGTAFKSQLTGDPEQDNLLTVAAIPVMENLARYQTKASVKKRNADSITQTTQDVTNSITDIMVANKSGDVKGESAARASLAGALKLPVIVNEELRHKTYADLTVIGLDMGEPTVLNYVRTNDIAFSPQEEKTILAAEARYNVKQRNKLDTTFQNDTADFEVQAQAASSREEMRLLSEAHQETWPGRKSNSYYIQIQDNWNTELTKRMEGKVLLDQYKQSKLASVQGLSKKIIDDTLRAFKTEILSDQTMTPEEAKVQEISLWKTNNLIDPDLQTKLMAGLTQPLDSDGTMHQNFEGAYEEMLSRYTANDDLALRHVNADQRNLFLNAKALTEYGGMDLSSAVRLIKQNKDASADFTDDDREDFNAELSDQVDSIMGRGFFNTRSWTDTFGLTQPIHNEVQVKDRIRGLAKSYLASGYSDPESAVEAARIKVMETHEQLGNSLIYNGGTPISDRMGIPGNRTQDAIQATLDAVTAEHPDFIDTIILGDPKGSGIIIANVNEFGAIIDTVQADLRLEGEHFRNTVLRDEQIEAETEEAAAVENSLRRRMADDRAEETGSRAPDDIVLAGLNMANDIFYNQMAELLTSAEHKKAARHGITTDDEMQAFKSAESKYFGRDNNLIEKREGNRQNSYQDTLGNLTGGIGHKLTEAEQKLYQEGTPIPSEVRDRWFKEDSVEAEQAAETQAAEAGITSDEFIKVLESVNFQLGTDWRTKFPKAWELIKAGDYAQAASEIALSASGAKSKWVEQTPLRVFDFQEALLNL